MKRNAIFYCLITIVLIIGLQSCAKHFFRSNYKDVNDLIHNAAYLQTKPYLKAHLKNGDIIILKDTWQIDTTLNIVNGAGSKYNFNRKLMFEGSVNIPIDSVSIFETNKKLVKPETNRVAALSILAGVDAIIGLLCLSNPKACFGSCPTFYINENDNFHYADAEGFSDAISPCLEYADIDALNQTQIKGNRFSITMKNEALETHCVKDVKLLAYPLNQNERIYHYSASNKFYLCENTYQLSNAKADEGDITSLLKNKDREERFSLSDEQNLKSKESVYLTFEQVEHTKELGLLLNFRQTMMTTYLFYSAMGYMGNQVSDRFAMFENDTVLRNKHVATYKELGGIDVYLYDEQASNWQLQHTFDEKGPIAINKQIVPLQQSTNTSKVKIKLVLNRGLWRIDYASLTNIKEKVTPKEVSVSAIYNKGRIDNFALNQIIKPEKYLISMPGDEFKFDFELPHTDSKYELFLYSKGYYLEWMREEWIKEKNLLKLNKMFNHPKKYLKEVAKTYKQYEMYMESEFWDSKIDTKNFSYYEN